MEAVMIAFAGIAFVNLSSHNGSSAVRDIEYSFLVRRKHRVRIFSQVNI